MLYVNKSLSGFFVILLSILVVVPSFVIGVLSINLYRSQQDTLLRENQSETANRISLDYYSYLNGIRSELSGLSRSITFDDRNKTKYLTNRLIDENTAYDQLAIVDTSGMEYVKVSRNYSYQDDELSQSPDSLLLKQALSGGKPLGDIQISKFTNLPVVSLAVPIRDLSDEVIGAIVAEIKINNLFHALSQVGMSKGQYAYIVDREGNLIAYQEVSSVLAKKSLKNITIVDSFLKNGKQTLMYNGIEGKRVIGAYAVMPEFDWGIIVEYPSRLAFAQLNFFILMVGSALIISIVMVVVFTLKFFFTKIINPLEKLTTATTSLSSGKLDVRVDVTSKDEMGMLAYAFNHMITDLQKSQETIQQYSQELEKKVQERTEQLNRKLEELEKMNHLMVDRELKMVELKKELEKLKSSQASV